MVLPDGMGQERVGEEGARPALGSQWVGTAARIHITRQWAYLPKVGQAHLRQCTLYLRVAMLLVWVQIEPHSV